MYSYSYGMRTGPRHVACKENDAHRNHRCVHTTALRATQAVPECHSVQEHLSKSTAISRTPTASAAAGITHPAIRTKDGIVDEW